MTNLFLYGTLQYLPHLEAVIGDISHLNLRPVVLPGYRRCAMARGPFPAILPDRGAVCGGLLAEGLRDVDLARLDYYEGGYDYTLSEVVLKDGTQALVYLSNPDVRDTQGPWSLDDWVRDWSAIACAAAREVMTYMGRKSPQQVAGMFPMIRARAWSSLIAQKREPDARTLRGAVHVIERRRSYAEFFALDDFRLTHERFDGTLSPPLDRAVLVAADAVIVLPYDPVRDVVLLVEQFRMGPYARGDRECWQLEPIAGRVDAGESPETCARREAREEAGLTLGALHDVARVYPTPGTSTEFYHVFVAIADLPPEAARLGGLADEDEDIRAHLLSCDALMELHDSVALTNAPLVLAACWLARHRDRLRAKS